ncbi:hypothetical protein WJX73_003581 [Symbiochloris irregularis]|uniref:Zinc finger with UFM1-specific peptidase domain protein n=1 Tax=Symbiochloris irregularis TaxID=706552 RepID=A0AAW1P4T4_9CHLO
MEVCPVCTLQLPRSEIQQHCDSHFAEEPLPAVSAPTVACEQCGAQVALTELDSHELAHSLQQDLAAAAGTAAPNPPSQPNASAPRAQENTAGQDGARQAGACFQCGQQGHFKRDCPQNPNAKPADRPQPISAEASVIASCQVADPQWQRPGDDVMPLLHACLQAQGERLPGIQYQAFLAGGLQHICTQPQDAGWGCGWRNIQMLTSHLLLRSAKEMQDALFNGSGFVPSIPHLQAWLECAWKAGFDAQGAAELQWQVQGTRRWVGTTEAAALLRYFGLRAQIVDIRGQVLEAQSADDSSLRHPGVQCDGCGQSPIQGPRFTSTGTDDYDLCRRCKDSGRYQRHGPFVRLAGPGEAVSHAALLQWVWGYFSGNRSHAATPTLTSLSAAQPSTRRSPVGLSGKPPLYFQHQGHSRTIVGIERESAPGEAEKFTLLVIDPSCHKNRLRGALQSKKGWPGLVRHTIDKLVKPEYQILFVEPGLASAAERDSLKVVAASEKL